jgi:hypothetical protein
MKNNVSQMILKVEKSNELVQVIRSGNKSRFLRRLARLQTLNTDIFSLSIVYKPIIDSNNIKIKPTNKGVYKSKQDLRLALFAFLED